MTDKSRSSPAPEVLAKIANTSEAKTGSTPAAKTQPQEGENPIPTPKAAIRPASEPETEVAPEPQSKVQAEPNTEANADVAKLINTTLGDILLAGVLKDPENAGRIIAKAISHAETPSTAATATESKATPDVKTGTESQPNAPAKESPAPTPATAK